MVADPNLTASIFADGLLDEVFQEIIAPFWADFEGKSTSRLWGVRYNRRGEHLKLRLHIDPSAVSMVRQDLEHRTRHFIKSISLPPTETRNLRNHSPAIDLDDELEEPAKDRSLTWTTYRRSSVTLGGEPLLSSDTFAEHMSRCLSAGLELLLVELSSGVKCSVVRQKLLLKALVIGLGAVGLGRPGIAKEYLEYHRDWLLRFFVEDPEEEAKVRQHFTDLAGKMSPTIEGLCQMTMVMWESTDSQPSDTWQSSLNDLAVYLEPFRQDEKYQVDPFALDVVYTPLFKVFHGVANQYGLRPMEEAYTHHLLCLALSDSSPMAPSAIEQVAEVVS